MTVNNNIRAAASQVGQQISKRVETKPVSPQSEGAQPAPVQTDKVELKKGFDSNAVPADDDGPGAGGGYDPTQDPAESDGPGAGGGYNSREIPSDDDGPGAGGGYVPRQDPTESDGPGAGGGYAQISSFTGPLMSFVPSPSSLKWTSLLLPDYPVTWTGNALFVEAQSVKKSEENSAGEPKSR